MRLFLLPLFACCVTGAIPAQVPPTLSTFDARPTAQCRDRIEQVRYAAGQPKLDREPADLEKPLLIAAVDKRIDGCAVMQMHRDVNDLRPLPSAADGPVQLQPAR